MPPRLPPSLIQLPPAFLLPRIPVIRKIAIRGIRSIVKPKYNRFNHNKNLPVLNASVQAALQRRAWSTPPRTGVIGIKKGMSSFYDRETGERHPVTVIQLDRVQVVAHKTPRKNGYYAVQVGSGVKYHQNVTRPMLGHFAMAGVSPKRHLVEFKVKDKDGLLEVGSLIPPSWFQEGQYVDARANCHGKGFAGGMKRHGFSGQPASHGTSLTHRAMGSAGQSQGGGSRVYPGKRMAGRMGGQQVTVQNIKVMKVDDETGIVVLHGCIPGPKKAVVKLQDAIKKPWPEVSKIPSTSVKLPNTTKKIVAAKKAEAALAGSAAAAAATA